MGSVMREIVLEEGAEFSTYLNAQRRYRQALVNKWQWFLEESKGLPAVPKHLWEAMAILFENQQAQSTPGLLEATLTTDVTLPQRYALPLIRNIYPQLLAAKICSVQPMPLESGGVAKIFWQDFEREDTGNGNTSLTQLDSDYALGAEDSVPKRIKMTIVSESLTAIKDILGASWSTEVMEDARGALGIDVEAELVQQMGGEIAREIDNRVLNEMMNGAGAGNVDWYWTVEEGYTAKEWYETLGHAIIDAEDDIFGYRYRKADWILAGRTVAKFIRKMQGFVPTRPNDPATQFSLGISQIGTIDGMWDVYTSVMTDSNKALLGCYPRSQTDTGYIFAPYIPLAPMPLVYAEYMPYDDKTFPGGYRNTDKWSRNVRTRYGKRMVVPEMYATISIAEED